MMEPARVPPLRAASLRQDKTRALVRVPSSLKKAKQPKLTNFPVSITALHSSPCSDTYRAIVFPPARLPPFAFAPTAFKSRFRYEEVQLVPQPQRAKTCAPLRVALSVPKRNITEAPHEHNRAVVSLRAGCSSEVNRSLNDSAPMLNGCEPTESLGIVGLRAILAFEQRRRRASI